MINNILAVDIGGSKLLVGIVDENGQVLAYRKNSFNNHNLSQESVLNSIISECRELLREKLNFSSIGISVPGLVDSKTGMWVYACFSKIRNFPIAKLLFEEFKRPVYIENDANNCMYAERMFGHTKNVSDFIWITVSNGVGSGIFLENKPFIGSGGNAGEIGHINVVNNGAICSCGNKGCLEAYASGPSIVRRFNEKTGTEINGLTAKDIARLAKSGNEDAIEIFKETGFYLGKAIALAVNLINVPMVVLGGGISMDYELFEKSMLESVDKFIYRNANVSLLIQKTALNYEASLIGAAAYAMICSKHYRRL
jgi:predicted NBD/HSP70 family sugar kinase